MLMRSLLCNTKMLVNPFSTPIIKESYMNNASKIYGTNYAEGNLQKKIFSEPCEDLRCFAIDDVGKLGKKFLFLFQE